MNIIYLKQTIEKAILDKKWLVIDYVGTDLAITRDRVVEPFELLKDKRNDKDVVRTWCYYRNEGRYFQLEGIGKVTVIDPVKATEYTVKYEKRSKKDPSYCKDCGGFIGEHDCDCTYCGTKGE